MKGIKNINSEILSNPLVITIGVILILIIVLAVFKPTSPFLNLGLGVNAHIGNIKGSFELEAFNNNDAMQPTLVLFMSPGCGHCKAMKPEWDKLTQTYNGDITIHTIDCSDQSNSKLARAHGVQGYPTIRYYPNGLYNKTSFNEYEGERNYQSFMGFLDNIAANN